MGPECSEDQLERQLRRARAAALIQRIEAAIPAAASVSAKSNLDRWSTSITTRF